MIHFEKVFAERSLLGLGPDGGWSLLHSAHHPKVARPVRVLAFLCRILASALESNEQDWNFVEMRIIRQDFLSQESSDEQSACVIH